MSISRKFSFFRNVFGTQMFPPTFHYILPQHGTRPGGMRKRLNPPTTACGATSVFETPSVLRESLPSYSAKPGAFYAPRALRWTTPPRGRTDPFRGPKIKPMFHLCSMLFQDDLEVENEGQNEVNSCQNRAWAPSKTLLESWSRVAAGSHFGLHFGQFLDLWNP